ncbi:4-hydroxybenzoate polyprenyl transferase [Mycena sanguinolenta]|uniref:4-hydroxybenzoate polyprenyl transferase n=1 Tax=Mycena sanguinolenta TaxID=230812 RepID=A0A8H6YXN5_9AGAR|nr:4-hydroxybenzoate polyprenyl transferase [Mycena sanguinolenta]
MLSLPYVRPFLELARVHKPAGALLIMWPFGAGCIWNDIIDRDLDKQVERTRHRPLADGRVSISSALIFLAVHLALLSLSVLPIGNRQLLFLAFITIFPLAGGYPFIKRISYWPQAWLGMPNDSIQVA